MNPIHKNLENKIAKQKQRLINEQKEIALITSIIINEDILGGTIFQTFDKAYQIAINFNNEHGENWGIDFNNLDFDEAVIKYTKNQYIKTQ